MLLLFNKPLAGAYVLQTFLGFMNTVISLKGHRHDWGQCLFTNII